MKTEEIMQSLISFFSVAIVFLTVIAIIFFIFCKKFKFNNKNIELYGLLLNLNTTSLISISSMVYNKF